MEKDKWHEAYRKYLVPHLAVIREICHEEGAYASFLSGAGPTILILSPEEKTEALFSRLQALDKQAKIDLLHIDTEGVQVF